MKKIELIVASFAALSQQRKLIVAGMAAAIFILTILAVSFVGKSEFLPLYKNLDVTDASRIEADLIAAGFNTQLSPDGTSVLVEKERMARARMALAELGTTIKGEPGWELFDEQSGLALNSFLQRVNRLRALEGELARSIQTIDGVRSARVHLVLPERKAFSRQQSEPRASVVVRAAGGLAITRKQAVAIRNLVASSVEQLQLQRVTVLTASGELILADNSEEGSQPTLHSARATLEERLAAKVQEILAARVGAGNSRVKVSVDLSTVSEKLVQQTFDPEQQVARSTETKVEERTGSNNTGNVGVETNIPLELGADAGAKPDSTQSKNGEKIEYEIGSTRREILRNAGDLQRLSVAVLVNGIFSVNGSQVEYAERSPEELKKLTELVKSAVGFSEERNDSITVESFRFMDYSMELGRPAGLSVLQQVARNIGGIMRGAIAMLIVGFVIILAVRPTLNFLSEQPQQQLSAVHDDSREQGSLLKDERLNVSQNNNGLTRDAQQLPGEAKDSSDILRNRSHDPIGNLKDQSQIEILAPDGLRTGRRAADSDSEIIKERIDSIQKLATERPEDVLRVLRAWLTTGKQIA